MLVDILGIKNVSRGNAFTELVNGVVNAAVPALAAILLTIFTVSELYWGLPLISYISSFMILYLVIKMPSQKILNQNNKDSSIKDSFRYAIRNNQIRPILILGCSTLIWGITQPLVPVYCRDVLNLDGAGYSLITSANFLGAIFGSVFLILLGRRLATGKLLSTYILLYSGFTYLFFTSQNAILSGICAFLGNMFITIWIANMFTSLQTIPDERYMGRVMSFFLSMFGLIGVGFIVGGFFGDLIGINLTVLIACLIIVSINVIVLFTSKSYRQLKI
tara:strand:- start:1184 stop:2011 length:828 start_codon:yes stop_codon:yes gene_type:complete